ncbi:MAG: pyridoxamine 5'-phosphate oxidase [Chitinophagaceae bacterium]|nr:MAG: pyridoxamine 5'-phosphate oxidase [Chitinophagaceae bacterium]
MSNNVSHIRKEYSLQSLSEKEVDINPILQFENWWQDAIRSEVDEANAMTLATASSNGLPSARIVLLKGFSEKGFVFFGNYESYKGQQLAENPRASLLFFWKELQRQVRIVGIAKKICDEESDAYFHSRPLASQLGACVSPQSRVIENRKWLDDQFEEVSKKMSGSAIARPNYWGGYLVQPIVIEFWQGRINRLHDRLQYTLQENGSWKIERLAP